MKTTKTERPDGPNNRSPGRGAMRDALATRARLVTVPDLSRRARRDHGTAAWNEPLNAAGLALPRPFRRALAKVRKPLHPLERAVMGALVRRDGR